MALSGAKPEFDPLAGQARARIVLVDAETKVHQTVSEVLNSVSCELVVFCSGRGKGISSEELVRIFEPVLKVSGLRFSAGNWGLFSSRQIIQEHGGQIVV